MGGFGGGARVGGFGGPGTAFARGVAGQHLAARGIAGQHFAQARGPFHHERNFARRRHFVPRFGFFDDYDDWCSYGYPYYTTESCYPLGYPPAY